MAELNQTATVHPIAEAAVAEFLENLFGSVAFLDPETVYRNMQMACAGNTAPQDRSLNERTAKYLLSHFALILAGLATNADFRMTFAQAVSIEIALEGKDADFVKRMRTEMRSAGGVVQGKAVILNLSAYDDALYKQINRDVADSFKKTKPYHAYVDEAIAALDEEARMQIGFCASNFMYVIRAFAYNGAFLDYVRSVLRSVQEFLDIA